MKYLSLIYKDIRMLFANKNAALLMLLPLVIVALFSISIPENIHFQDKTFFFAMSFAIPLSFSFACVIGSFDFENHTMNVLLQSGFPIRTLFISKVCSTVIFSLIYDLILFFICTKPIDFPYLSAVLVIIFIQLPLLFLGVSYGFKKQCFLKTDIAVGSIVLLYIFPSLFSVVPTTSIPTYLYDYFPSSQLRFLFVGDSQINYIVLTVWLLLYTLLALRNYKNACASLTNSQSPLSV